MNWEDHRIKISIGKINTPITAVAKNGSATPSAYFYSTRLPASQKGPSSRSC